MDPFLEDLRLQVQCSLCKGTMVEPKLIQCFHIFCKACIKSNSQLDGQVNKFKCPQCASLTELQELNDIENLEISVRHSRIVKVLSIVENQKTDCSVSGSHCEALWYCLECDCSLCGECQKSHSKFPYTKDHNVVFLSEMTKEDIDIMLKKESRCKTHTNQDVELHCQDCDELLCLLCWRDHKDKKHNITSLNEFITSQKDCLSKTLQEIAKMDTNEKEKKQQEQIALDVKRDGEKAQEEIERLVNNLKEKLNEHKQEVLNEIMKGRRKAERNLRTIHHTSGAQDFITHLIQNGTASEIIGLQSDLESGSSKPFTYNAFEKDFGRMKFQPNEKLCEEVCAGIGLIQTFKRADPDNSLFKVQPNTFEAMKRSTLTVTLRTYKGEIYNASPNDITIRIIPEDDVRVGEKQVTADGQIEVPFTPGVPGQLTAEVHLDGDPVSNSPLVMDIKPQLIKERTGNFKLKDALNTGSRDYAGIAVNKLNTKIAIADWAASRVRVFNMPDGESLLLYGSKGSARGRHLKNPCGLAFLNENNLVIADSNNHRICIVDTTTGALVKLFGCKGKLNGHFNHPCGVHVDDDSNIIVSDSGNHRVQVFTKNGDYLYQCAIPGENPISTITHNGLLYVSAGSVVHVIDMKDNKSPTTVTTIGGDDYRYGRLQDPRGLAIDENNNLLVCDNHLCEVFKYTLDGRYVGKTNKLDYNPNFIAALYDGQIICSTDKKGTHFLRQL